MFLVNIDHIPGTDFEVLGLVQGAVVQSRDAGSDLFSGFQSFAGGELTAYTALLNEARSTAVERMEREAERLGADAVINVRFVTSEIMQGAAEVLAYGTAVKYK